MNVYYIVFCSKGDKGGLYSTTLANNKSEAIKNALKAYKDDFAYVEEDYKRVRGLDFKERI